jgi:hypothetical protein
MLESERMRASLFNFSFSLSRRKEKGERRRSGSVDGRIEPTDTSGLT